MSGLPCAKAIIDNGHALVQAMSCMNASIYLHSTETQPTEAMEDEFKAATKAVADVAARIEKYVRTGIAPISPATSSPKRADKKTFDPAEPFRTSGDI